MKKLFYPTLLFLLTSMAMAEPQQTAAHFLNLGVGAREIAMGGASVAISDDVNASYWNPAGLVHLSKTQFGLTHGEWLLGSRYDSVGVAMPTAHMSIGLNGLFLTQPGEQGRDENRHPTGNFTAGDMALGLAAAVPIGPRFSIGTNFKYLESRIGSYYARGLSVDMGTQFALSNKRTHLGLAFRNMGPSIGFVDQKDPLPFNATIGIGHEFLPSVLVTTEYGYDVHERLQHVVVGTEYKLSSGFSMRAGYLSNTINSINQSYDKKFLSINGLTGGLGIKISQFRLDYAYTPFGTLGDVHRFSIMSQFGSSGSDTVFVRSDSSISDNSPAKDRIIFDLPHEWQVSTVPYVVKQGDTLRSIAKQRYGQESLWHRILQANPITISNPDNLTPGQTIFIPK